MYPSQVKRVLIGDPIPNSHELHERLDKIRALSPKLILSAHMLPAGGKTELFLEWLLKVPTAPPFVTPDQKVLEQILKQA